MWHPDFLASSFLFWGGEVSKAFRRNSKPFKTPRGMKPCSKKSASTASLLSPLIQTGLAMSRSRRSAVPFWARRRPSSGPRRPPTPPREPGELGRTHGRKADLRSLSGGPHHAGRVATLLERILASHHLTWNLTFWGPGRPFSF